MADTVLVAYEPLHPVYGGFGPTLTQRLLRFQESIDFEGDAGLFTRTTMAKLTAGDPSVLLLAVVEPATAQVVGHCLATLERHGQKAWVFVWQCQLDKKQTEETRQELLSYLHTWGKAQGATQLLMCTHRSDKAWERKYGFTGKRVMMTQPIEVG